MSHTSQFKMHDGNIVETYVHHREIWLRGFDKPLDVYSAEQLILALRYAVAEMKRHEEYRNGYQIHT